MAPLVVGVGGAHSGSGKTTVVCRLLEGPLKGWGAMKCTPTALYSSVTDDPTTLWENEKDTSRYLEAGAGGVVWVRAKWEDIDDTLAIALGRLSHLEGVVVEGNSAVVAVRPDIVIFNAGEPGMHKGGSADEVLAMADLVLFSGEAPADVPGKARLIHRDDVSGIIKYVSEALWKKK